MRHFGGAFGGQCYSCVSRRGSQSSENSLTHINVANGHCPLQLEFYFQLPTLVLRTAEPRSPLTVWVQQVLHRILGILSQREKEDIRTLTEPKAKEDAHEGGIPTSPNLSRHFNDRKSTGWELSRAGGFTDLLPLLHLPNYLVSSS